VVDNAFFEEPKRDVRQASAYKTLKAHKARFAMPRLSEEVFDELEARFLSLSDFMRQPMSSSGKGPVPDGLAPELRVALRDWVFSVFQEIDRVMRYLTCISLPPPSGSAMDRPNLLMSFVNDKIRSRARWRFGQG